MRSPDDVSALGGLRGRLVVSVQFPRESPLGTPEGIAALAEAAVGAGAAGVRVESFANVAAVRSRVGVPVIGIVKRTHEPFEPYITPTLRDVDDLLAAGAQIVAFDATRRPRPDASTTEQIVSAIRRGGALAMADCALSEDGRFAHEAGAEILATTLCGYTGATRGMPLPALTLAKAFATFGAFTVCEGGVDAPERASAALSAGAAAVVVGTAITANLDGATAQETVAQRTRAFVAALSRCAEGSEAL